MRDSNSHTQYVPALRFRWLTRAYDPLMERWSATGRIRRAVIEALDLAPGLRLLELGCGPGRLAVEIKRRAPQVTIDAIDGDPAVLAVARRHAVDAGVEIAFREGDITTLPGLGSYDRVYSTLVFHHLSLKGKQAALAGLLRVLAPGAKVVIADFGRPRDPLQWVLFSIAGWADGIQNTAPHRDGRFERLLREAFAGVESVAAWRTMFGTIEMFVCRP